MKIPNRGHALTIDHGQQEVAQTALDFVKRFVPAVELGRDDLGILRPLPIPVIEVDAQPT